MYESPKYAAEESNIVWSWLLRVSNYIYSWRAAQNVETPAAVKDDTPSLGLNRIKLGPNELGRGTFAVVNSGTCEGKDVAIKMNFSQIKAATMEKEIEIHQTLKHPNIVELIAVEYEKASTYTRFYMAMELMPEGDLTEIIQNKRSTLSSWTKRRSILKNILEGLKYLHDKGVIHRDIKPDNILIKDGRAKIGDFGLSMLFDETKCSFSGTLDYTSPEVIQMFLGKANSTEQDDKPFPYTSKVDIYAFALLMLVVACFSAPLKRNIESIDSLPELLQCLLDAADKKRNDVYAEAPMDTPKDIKLLINESLSRDPNNRPTATAALLRVSKLGSFKAVDATNVTPIDAPITLGHEH